MRVCFSRFVLPKHSFTSIRTVNFRPTPVYTTHSVRFLVCDSSSSAALAKMGDATAKEGANLHLDRYWLSYTFANANSLVWRVKWCPNRTRIRTTLEANSSELKKREKMRTIEVQLHCIGRFLTHYRQGKQPRQLKDLLLPSQPQNLKSKRTKKFRLT